MHTSENELNQFRKNEELWSGGICLQ